MLKVLHFYKSYYPDTFGGVEQVIYQICEATHLAGVESTVLTLSPRGNIDDAMIDHHHIYYVKTDFELLSTPFSLLALKNSNNWLIKLILFIIISHIHLWICYIFC